MDAKTLGDDPINVLPNDVDRLTPDTDGWGCRGLTKRELFAAMAMQGLLANYGGPIQSNPRNGWGLVNCETHQVAATCLEFADAMLSELAKEQP